jgi:hypothetical protein
MKRLFEKGSIACLFAAALILFIAFPSAIAAVDVKEEAEEEYADWPLVLEDEAGRIVIYQPQLETFVEDKITARAAISVQVAADQEPVFGAIWIDARVLTDRETRTVNLIEIKIPAAKFPEAEQEDVDALIAIVEREVPKQDLSFSLDHLLTSLEFVDEERSASEKLNNDPPVIYYRTTSAVLVMIDGEPKLKDIENTNLKYVVNTPFFITYDTSKKRYYLRGSDWWFSAKELTGKWKEDNNPPKEAVEIVKKAEEEAAKEAAKEEGQIEEEEGEMPDVVPEIIVSTEPAEMIISDGPASYQPIGETGLLYMSNTESDVIMDIDSQLYYVLLAGRWYRSKSMTGGEWTYVPSDELPDDFPDIPPDSDMGNVLSSVAGTQQAREAVLENEIPQTAVVDRSEASVEVTYDGDPKFEKIEDTDMSYAVNTDKSVLLIDGSYYCCDEAVWFVSDAPSGPWTVCVEIPGEVQSIPPDNPVYNVKYVYVYEYTPEIVYIGYTPGYTCSYVYNGCVVYGTGYWYRPWYGYYYYPRPVTYGFGVHWNPYTGWGFSFGVSYGWMRIGWGGWGWGYHGWWGPGGYRYGYRHGYHRGYHHGYRHGYHRGAHAGYRAGYQAGQRQQYSSNLYKNRSTGVKHTGTPRTQPAGGTAQRQGPGARPQNNVYADRNGNVYRQGSQGWEKKDKSGWSKSDQQARQTDRSTQRSAGSRDTYTPSRSRDTRQSSQSRDTRQSSSRSNVSRDAQARQRSSTRTNDYRSSQRSTRQKSSGKRSTRPKSTGRRR